MVRSFYNQSGQRLRGVVTTNGRNDEVLVWTSPNTLSVSGVRLQPLNSEEIRPTRTGETTTHRLLAPYGVDILLADRWVQDGITYEVEGDAQDQLSPTGVADHAEILLRRTVG